MSCVVIVDYGMGNLFSVKSAVEACGFSVKFSSKSDEILSASHVILPGVGAFGDGIKALRERGIDETLQSYVKRGKPLLGICLGMQLLLTESQEFGSHMGLDIIKGIVEEIPKFDVQGRKLSVPHVGWSPVAYPDSKSGSQKNIFKNIETNNFYYFLHSFYCKTADSKNIAALTGYGGHYITAAIQQGNVMGTQFHPERSGPIGLKLLQNFLNEKVYV